jgi:arylsulfatase
MPGSPQGIPEWAPTIADLIKQQGYVTGQFGKNHLGDRDSHLPTVHGFDEFLGNLYHLNAEEEPETYYYPKDPEFRKKYGPRGVLHTWSDGKGGQKIEDTGPLTQARMPTVDLEIYDAEQKFVANAAKEGKPFFVWFNTTRMHVWTRLKKSAEGRTGIGLYPDGMVEHDDMVGGVLKQLKDLGIADNTIVVYGTDNGAETATWPDGGITPYHGEKGTAWEGGFRVPMIVRWPGVIKPGTIVNDIFSQEDWLPTLLAAAGVPDIVEKVKAGYTANGKTWKVHLDGYNFIPYFKGEAKRGPREEIYYFGAGGELNAVRWNDWKVHFAVQNGNIATATRGRARLAGDRQPARGPVRKGAARVPDVYALVRGQHLAVRASAAEAQDIPGDVAGVSVPAGQQPERRGHQLQLPAGDAGHETAEGTRKPVAAEQLTRPISQTLPGVEG